MNYRTTKVFLRGLLVAVAACAVFAGSASAAPAWKFNGTALAGKEKIVGAAEKSGMTMSGMTTTCANFLYSVTAENVSGTGKGSVTELPLFECTTNTPVCTVETIGAEKLPWPVQLKTISTKQYIVIESVRVGIKYKGTECAFGGTLVPVTGSAGGLIDNTTESATFNAASFTATGTALKFGAQAVQWTGVFPTEAFEWHRGEALSVS